MPAMAPIFEPDKTDLLILSQMVNDSSISYAELGKRLFVSAGTIHVRIKKMQEAGIIVKTSMEVNFRKLRYDVTAFVGVFLEKSSMYDRVAQELQKIPEILRLNYTTGNYSMFIEILCRDMDGLRRVLHDDLQKIKGIERTETFISLEENFRRRMPLTT